LRGSPACPAGNSVAKSKRILSPEDERNRPGA